jgi:hypothetical protein
VLPSNAQILREPTAEELKGAFTVTYGFDDWLVLLIERILGRTLGQVDPEARYWPYFGCWRASHRYGRRPLREVAW